MGAGANLGVSKPVAGYAMLAWLIRGKLPGVQKVGGLPVEAGGLSVPNFTRSKAGGLLGVS